MYKIAKFLNTIAWIGAIILGVMIIIGAKSGDSIIGLYIFAEIIDIIFIRITHKLKYFFSFDASERADMDARSASFKSPNLARRYQLDEMQNIRRELEKMNRRK